MYIKDYHNTKILILPYTEQLGTSLRDIEIANELKRIGFSNILFAGSGTYVGLISKYNFPVSYLPEVDFNSYRSHVDKSDLDIYSDKQLQEFVDKEIELIKKNKVDIIISDTRWSTYLSTRITKIPLISIVSSTLTPYSLLYTTLPTSHKLYKYRMFLGPFTGTIKKIFFGQCSRLYNQILQLHGLKRIRSLFDIIMGDYTIVPDFQVISPLSKTPSNIYQVGGIVLNSLSESPNWINRLDKKKTIIYLSFGSSGLFYEKVLKICVELFGNKDEYQIVTNSTELSHMNINNLPNNFFIEKFLSADEMLKYASIMLNHGGTGVINHALLSGVPVLCIPHQGEQEWNSYNIMKKKLGDFIFVKDVNSKNLHNKINRILNDKEIISNVKKVQKEIMKDKPIKNVGKIIENIIINERNK